MKVDSKLTQLVSITKLGPYGHFAFMVAFSSFRSDVLHEARKFMRSKRSGRCYWDAAQRAYIVDNALLAEVGLYLPLQREIERRQRLQLRRAEKALSLASAAKKAAAAAASVKVTVSTPSQKAQELPKKKRKRRGKAAA